MISIGFLHRFLGPLQGHFVVILTTPETFQMGSWIQKVMLSLTKNITLQQMSLPQTSPHFNLRLACQKSTPDLKKHHFLSLVFLHTFTLQKVKTSNPCGIYSTSWGSVFCMFSYLSVIFYGFPASFFRTRPRSLFTHFECSRDSPNRHLTFKSEALVYVKQRFFEKSCFS